MPATLTLKGRVTDAALGTAVPDAIVKIVGVPTRRRRDSGLVWTARLDGGVDWVNQRWSDYDGPAWIGGVHGIL